MVYIFTTRVKVVFGVLGGTGGALGTAKETGYYDKNLFIFFFNFFVDRPWIR
jgi:hypothetical protein